MFAALFTEFRKLNRSLAALLAIVAPSLIAIFLFFNLMRFDRAWEWTMVLQNGAAIWAFFMLPMSVTALTVLVAQMEHGPRSWEHLFALPVPRWRILGAKVVCVFAIVALMSAAVLATSIGAAWAAGELKPAVRPSGVLDLAGAAALFGRMYAAACLMVAVQLWAALRFRSFVPPLILGIGGTFFAVVASSARAGVFMPWQMPVNMLASEPERAALALTLGLGGGLVALAAMMIDLGRREMA